MKLDELILDEGPHDPNIFKVIFLVGGPGSGKSFVAKKVQAGTGLKIVDMDKVYEFIMNKHNLPLDTIDPNIHAKASDISRRRRSHLLDGRIGLIIDGTGRNYESIKMMKNYLMSIGYDSMMIYVNTDPQTAAIRNQERERKVSKEFFTKAHKVVSQNLGKFQNLFGHELLILDNTRAL